MFVYEKFVKISLILCACFLSGCNEPEVPNILSPSHFMEFYRDASKRELLAYIGATDPIKTYSYYSEEMPKDLNREKFLKVLQGGVDDEVINAYAVLAMAYRDGIGVKKSKKKFLEYIEDGCVEKFQAPVCEYILAEAYFDYKIIEKTVSNLNQSLKGLSKIGNLALNEHEANANWRMFRFSYRLYVLKKEQKDIDIALRYLKEASKAGHEKAQNRLAEFLYSGKNLPQDRVKAVDLKIKAALAGNGHAQVSLLVHLSNEKSNQYYDYVRVFAEGGLSLAHEKIFYYYWNKYKETQNEEFLIKAYSWASHGINDLEKNYGPQKLINVGMRNLIFFRSSQKKIQEILSPEELARAENYYKNRLYLKGDK